MNLLNLAIKFFGCNLQPATCNLQPATCNLQPQKKMENLLTDDKLTLIRITRNTLGRNLGFILSNHKLLDKKDLFFQIYMFLTTNKDFLDFGEYKVIIVNGKIKEGRARARARG
jgi:hypothetical protein